MSGIGQENPTSLAWVGSSVGLFLHRLAMCRFAFLLRYGVQLMLATPPPDGTFQQFS